jgi:4Fe-4S ferredoxin
VLGAAGHLPAGHRPRPLRGKRDCIEVCPNDVFEVRRIDDADFTALGRIARIKVRAHRMATAYTPNAYQCRACGLCVVACAEQAIVLRQLP